MSLPSRGPVSIALDSGDVHCLVVGPRSIDLVRGAEGRSRLDRALRDHMRFETASGEVLALDARDHAELPDGTREVRVRLGDGLLAVVEFSRGGARVREGGVVLSPFEVRYLSESGHPHPNAAGGGEAPRVVPQTDLHTHLAGAPRAEDLVRIGLEESLAYPRTLLEECGVQPARAADEEIIPLASLPAEALARIERSLALPLDRQSPFRDMERVYRLRQPVTKHPRAFVPMLRAIARDLAAAGTRYAELSAGEVLLADRLRAAAGALPAIEAETGVRLRFLAAFSRHDDWEWDLDLLDRIDDLAACPWIVGVDFMGHETGSTLAFARQLDRLAAWAPARRPGFVVRVHAGENPAHPENVRVAVEHAAKPGVCLRIGHGIYGVDDATLELMRARGVVVEINPSSNFALNNIQETRELPLVRYLRAGVDCVLGTDGHGIYLTSSVLEARAAWLSGATASDLDRVLAAERRYLALREEADRGLAMDAPIPDDRPARWFSPEIAASKAAARADRDAGLAARLAELGVARLDRDAIHGFLRGRRCVSVAGAWARAWPAMPEADRGRVREALDDLVASLDPAEVVLVTGGTRLGVEGELHARAAPRGIDVLGVLVAASPLDAIDPSLAAAAVLGEALFDKAAGLYELVKREDGLCLFFGGGNVVRDEIQTAQNLGLRYLLFEGVAGASGDKAKVRPRNAFRAAREAVARLHDTAFFRAPFEPFWHIGPNPTVDAAVFRDGPAGLEVLLIRRGPDAAAEPDRWALIGGFVHTDAPRGAPWRAGAEGPRDALVREVREEAGLDLAALAGAFTHVCDVEGGGRDERDTPTAWSRTSLFALRLDRHHGGLPIAGGDDASDARWWPVDALPSPLAFDHAALLAAALRAVAAGPA